VSLGRPCRNRRRERQGYLDFHCSLVVPFFYFGKVNPGTLAEPWFVVSHLYVLMAACKISLMRDVFSAWKPKVVEDIFQTQGRGAAFWCGFSGFINEFIGFFMILHPLLCGTFLMQLLYTDHGRRCGPLQFQGFWGHSIKESNVSWNVCECYTTVVMPYEVSLRISPTHIPRTTKGGGIWWFLMGQAISLIHWGEKIREYDGY